MPPILRKRKHPVLIRSALIALLLVGFWMRSASLARMRTMLHYDEAYHAIDALNVLRDPRLTPFFPGNFGREGGFVYWALSFVAALPGDPLAMRLAAVFLSVLALAAAARLAREAMGAWTAVWTLAALSALYWHVHISQLALRANLYVTLGTLAAAWLLRAYRSRRTAHWMAVGIATGLLGYTYFPSLVWMGVLGLTLLVWLAFDPTRRRGALVAGLCALVVFLPMVIYVLRHPDYVLDRPSTVAALSRQLLAHNARVWTRAWFRAGDPNWSFNLSGRPILGPPLGVLAVLGLLAAVPLASRRWIAPWLLTWGLAALMPSLLSDQAPHFLRAVGATVPLAVILGAGAALLSWGGVRLTGIGALALIPLVLFVPAGWRTYRDFHHRWLNHPEAFKLMEEPLNRSMDVIAQAPDAVPPDTRVYFSPYRPTHPVIVYRSVDIAPRPVGGFDSHQCLVGPVEGPAAYVSMTVFEPSFEAKLSAWFDTDVLEAYDGATRYTIFRADQKTGGLSAASPDYRFGDVVAIRSLRAAPEQVGAGAVVPFTLGIRPLRTPDRPLSVFIHLYGDPLPAEGGDLWAQADSQICATYPVALWQPEEMIIQPYDLAVPPDLPAGSYTVAMGVYLYPDGARLPVSDPGASGVDWVALHTLEVP